MLLTLSLNAVSAARAAAVVKSIVKAVGNNQLQLAINFSQWSGDFNYSLVLPASEVNLHVQSRQYVLHVSLV